MSGLISLKSCWVWDCPNCERDNFERPNIEGKKPANVLCRRCGHIYDVAINKTEEKFAEAVRRDRGAGV